jgi:HPt (histidine-containing phosphotransfer) domain-containing protein
MDNTIKNSNIPIPDLQYLKQMIGDDQEVLKEVLTIFIEEMPTMLRNLRESSESRDHDRLKSISHTMITELSTLGITSVLNDVKAINKGSREMRDMDETIDRIIRAVTFSIEYFKTLI